MGLRSVTCRRPPPSFTRAFLAAQSTEGLPAATFQIQQLWGRTRLNPLVSVDCERVKPCSLTMSSTLTLTVADGHAASNASVLFRPPESSGAGPG